MKRSSFLKSLGLLVGTAFIPESKPERLTLNGFHSNGIGVERMRITSSGNVGLGILNPKQILKVTKRVNGGMPPLEYRIK